MMIKKLYWKQLMRVDIKSVKQFNLMLAEIFKNSNLPMAFGCSIDSRNIKKGDIFFPIKGSQFNGNDFIKEAIDNGASMIFQEECFKASKLNIPIIRVKNIPDIIKIVAREWRSKLNCKIIGITGSNGKTSTKEILNKIISTTKETMSSKGNYNSTIGLPMSIFSISKDDQIGILEMGANKEGEIKDLSYIAKPDYGIVTNISNAHNEHFGTIQNIAKNKLELLKSIPKSGYSFINMDDPYLKIAKVKSKKITYGFKGSYDYNGKLIDNILSVNNQSIPLPYKNKAIAQNYLAAYSVAKTIGVKSSIIIDTLKNNSIYPGRGKIIEKNNITYIDDTYNANFASCLNGIKSCINIQSKRRVLVLGDMHELGNKTKSEHVLLGNAINNLHQNIDAVFGLGEYMQFTLDSITNKKILIKHFKSRSLLIKKIQDYCSNGDLVYVKGSRSMQMEKIIYTEEN